MKTFLNLIQLSFVLILSSFHLSAQNVDVLEKVHQISKSSRNGYLGDITPNHEKNTFDVVYVLPSILPSKIKTETYTFDQDLNLINTFKEEEEWQLMRNKFKWLTYRGEKNQFEMTSISATYKSELVLRKKEVNQKWNWVYGFYQNHVDILDKVKAKDDDGNKYVFLGGIYENYLTAKSLLFAYPKMTKTKMGESVGASKFDVLSADSDLKLEKVDEVSFNGIYRPVYSRPLSDAASTEYSNFDAPQDWITIFAASDVKGTTNKPTDYVYVRVSPEGKVKEKVEFSGPTNAWRFLEISEQNGRILLVGTALQPKSEAQFYTEALGNTLSFTSMTTEEQSVSANNNKGRGAAKFLLGSKAADALAVGQTISNAENILPTQEAIEHSLDFKNYDYFVVGLIENGQYKTTSFTAFQGKEPQSKDKKKNFWLVENKKVKIDNVLIEKDGSINMTCQEYDAQTNVYGKTFLFKYDTEGELTENFAAEIIQNDKAQKYFNTTGLRSDNYPTKNIIYQSKDGSKTYWFMNKVKDIRDGNPDYFAKPLYSIQYCTIDNKELTISENKDLGDHQEDAFFLYDPKYSTKLNDNLIMVSENKKGDKVLLSRFDLGK
jgi:hypothetical protein